MAFVSQVSSKKVLVIDDLPGMRAQLQQSLTHAGFGKLHVVATIKEALLRLKEAQYDVILCDYFLGEGTNGQQFLEYLRTKDLISRNTIFIIITAERNYESVVAAAECAPDDYLLKPFTAEQIISRLEKLIERQGRFAAIDKAHDAKDWGRVVEGCDRMLEQKDKYFVELHKIKGAALLKLDRAKEAAKLYQDMLALRPMPWAKLGLAKAQAMLGEREQAQKLAQELLDESPQFMATYDFLGGLLTTAGSKQEALDVLQQARRVSPGTMSRNREIGSLAVDTGQHEIAEQVMGEALKQHRYSPVREAQDYAILSRAMTEQGKSDQALEVLKEARSSFKDDASGAVLAVSECIAHHKSGNAELAEAALTQALAANPGSLSASVAAAVADACFALGKEAEGTELLKHVVQNNPDDARAQEHVQAVLASAGKGEAEARDMIERSAQEVIHINNEGVRKAEAGQLAEAIALLRDAADRLPNNLQIVGNAALALALDLTRNGNDAAKLQSCLRYRQQVAEKSPNYPKLAQIDAMLKKVAQP